MTPQRPNRQAFAADGFVLQGREASRGLWNRSSQFPADSQLRSNGFVLSARIRSRNEKDQEAIVRRRHDEGPAENKHPSKQPFNRHQQTGDQGHVCIIEMKGDFSHRIEESGSRRIGRPGRGSGAGGLRDEAGQGIIRPRGRWPGTRGRMIEVERLSKRYGAVRAVEGVSFSIGRGRDRGLARAERRGEVDDDADADDGPDADQRAGEAGRARRARRALGGPQERRLSAGECAAVPRDAGPGVPRFPVEAQGRAPGQAAGGGRRRDPDDRPGRGGRSGDGEPLEGVQPAGRAGGCVAERPGYPNPRRANGGAGPDPDRPGPGPHPSSWGNGIRSS